MKSRPSWSTRYGFYLAAVGSAFGLGNLWRFPYIVGESGGGAFVLIYFLSALFIGLPLLVAELTLGRSTRLGLTSAIKTVTAAYEVDRANPTLINKFVMKLKNVGYMAQIMSLLLLSYYAVVSGWVLFLALQFLFGLFRESPIPHADLFRILMSNGWLQVGLTSAHLLLCGLVVSKGLQLGIEKVVSWTAPLFVVILIYLVYQSLSLPGSAEALRFLFYPDFTRVESNTFIKAIGHTLFTLSLGFGAMTVFGSYLKDEVRLSVSAFRVMVMDTAISLCVGALIFPILMTGGYRMDGGPTVLFEAIPLLFKKLGLGDLIGFLFFLCTYMAAFGASLGLLEVRVSHLTEKKMSREVATRRTGAIAFLLTLVPAFSTSSLGFIQISGMGLLELLDSIIIHWMLPISALCISLIVGYGVKIKTKHHEFLNEDRRPSSLRLFSNWIFALRWLVPFLLLSALGLEIYGLFAS